MVKASLKIGCNPKQCDGGITKDSDKQNCNNQNRLMQNSTTRIFIGIVILLNKQFDDDFHMGLLLIFKGAT
jgi:hypothetical protein